MCICPATTPLAVIEGDFLPSLACLAVPLLFLNFVLRGRGVASPVSIEENGDIRTTPSEQSGTL